MICAPRHLLHALGTLVLAAALLAVPAPAGATISTLCTGYTSCANAGRGSGGYAQASGSMYWRMYSGHNCTNYAAYRMIRSGMPNTRPWDGGGNAEYWGGYNADITDTVPRVGSIAWWPANVYPAGSSGHVAYVEKVVSSSEIIISQDSWGGDFSWARITKTSGWPRGFIHFNDVPMRSKSAPSLTGDAKVGSTLTVTRGTWSPRRPTALFEWRAGGRTISTGSANTLTVTKALVGKRVRVKVTASKLGYPDAVVSSNRTGVVQPGVIRSTNPPTVSGEAAVGQTLQAFGGTWNPRPEGRTFQWLADGSPVAGATERTLELGPDLAGARMSVRVTASRTGYDPVSATSAATAPVERAELEAPAAPTVTGVPRPGEVLTLTAGEPRPTATRTVRWLRDGVVIPDADRLRYTLTRADLGARITGTVTYRRTGYKALRLSAPATDHVRAEAWLRARVERGARRFVVTARPRAEGVDLTRAPVQVVRGGVVLAESTVTADGTARLVVRDVPPGERTYRIVLPETDASTRAVLLRTITLG